MTNIAKNELIEKLESHAQKFFLQIFEKLFLVDSTVNSISIPFVIGDYTVVYRKEFLLMKFLHLMETASLRNWRIS